MNVLVLVLWGLLLLKLGWNITVPVVLHRRAARGDEGGISLAPAVEIVLVVLLVVFSSLSAAESWWCQWATVLGLGLASIVVSYILMGAVGFLARPRT